MDFYQFDQASTASHHLDLKPSLERSFSLAKSYLKSQIIVLCQVWIEEALTSLVIPFFCLVITATLKYDQIETLSSCQRPQHSTSVIRS